MNGNQKDQERKDQEREEQALVKMYMELTGTSESGARNVFMFVCPQEGGSAETPGQTPPGPEVESEPEPKRRPGTGRPGPRAVLLAALLGLGLAGRAGAAESVSVPAPHQFITQPLSLADAVNLTLQQNPNILKARRDLEASQGVVIQTRAVALPKLAVTGSFNAVQPNDVDVIAVTNFPGGLHFGSDQNWTSQIRLVQSIYEGGRILSALRAARLTKEQSALNYQTVVADTVQEVEIAYYDVLLSQDQITVQEASVELLTHELSDTRRRFDAGTVPRFNVLRAEVELANARPRLIRARHSSRIAKNNLANLLGFNVPRETFEDIPLNLSGKLEAEPYQLELPRAVALALERRTELESLRKARALRHEDVTSAKAGYKPAVQAFAGYDVHNSLLHSDLSWEDHGWITGVQLTWNLFDGFATRGRVKEATARYERSGLELEDTGRRIELEVRTAHSTFIEAKDVLDSQKKVVEQAEEALRLARSRYDAGTGTQLDVLSAQTALTEARTTEIQALHDYSVARARLERAVGMNVPAPAAGQR